MATGQASSQLCKPYGMLHRSIALEWSSLEAGFAYSFDSDKTRLQFWQRYNPNKGGLWSAIFEQVYSYGHTQLWPRDLRAGI